MATTGSERPQATRPGRWPKGGDFWRMWLIGALQFGVRWLDMLAVGVFAYQTTGSAFIVTLLMTLRMLPIALFGMFTGAAADRFEGRAILLVTLGLCFITSTTMALLAWAGLLAIWHVAVAAVIVGTVWASDIPVRRLMIGRIVGADRMANAMALDAGSVNGARMAGPAIGGAVLAIWGIAGCFAVGAAMYLIAFITAATIRYRSPARSHARGMLFGNILAAFKVAVNDRSLAGFFAITLIYNLFCFPILSLLPVIGQDHLGLGPRGIGLLAAMEGAGALLGALTWFFRARAENYARIYVFSTMTYATALTSTALLPYPALTGLALMIAGFGGVGFSIMQSTLIFRGSKPEMRGQLLGLLTVVIGTGPLGLLQVGLLAETFGARAAVLISGSEAFIALALTRYWWRAIRTGSD